jgi:hypothetical protein
METTQDLALALGLSGAFMLVVFGMPAARILRKAGLSPLWALICAVPLGVIFVLWFIAYKRWPSEARASAPALR